MPISPIASNQAAANSNTSKMGTGEIAQEDFFQLMIDQLKNQNPLSPQDNSEFLTQMVQFTTMDIMSNMNDTMEMNEAIQLIGKDVLATYHDSDGQLKSIEGTVKSVLMNDGAPMLEVGDMFVSLDSIMIAAAPPEPEPVVPPEEPEEGEPVEGEPEEGTEGEEQPVEGTEGV